MSTGTLERVMCNLETGQVVWKRTARGEEDLGAITPNSKPPTDPKAFRPFQALLSHLDFDEWEEI